MKTLALLCLVAHALFISATHFHSVARIDSSLTAVCITATGDDSHGATDRGSESHCHSCCLQRNFVSDVRTPSVFFDLVDKGPSYEVFLSEPGSCGPFLILSDRAPPLV
ncbi:MAG TPA: hypothetical protein VF131_06605 [Blastocatellia bacterium]|nr:hypothetical protein [Blastocatellia bacterium]